MRVGLFGLVPNVPAILPQELIDGGCKEVVALADLKLDAEEIVVERLVHKHVAILALEELTEISVVTPSYFIHFLWRARQLVLVLFHKILLLGRVAEDVLAVVIDDEVRHLREAVELVGLVRIGRIRRLDRGMEVFEHLLQTGVRVDILVDIEIVTALDEGPEPLAVRDRHIVIFSPEVSEALRRV